MKNHYEYFSFESPVGLIGVLTLSTTSPPEKFICRVKLKTNNESLPESLANQSGSTSQQIKIHRTSRPDEKTVDAFNRYFAGQQDALNVLSTQFMRGTPFQQRVWNTLKEIPYGQTRSYGWLAAKIGKPRAYRAVGSANGKNPIPIIFPCHRVINADGGIGGYSSGTDIKLYLLKMESRHT